MESQIESFKKGFYLVLQQDILQYATFQQLHDVICGINADKDVLQKLISVDSEIKTWFWDFYESLSPLQLKKLLEFWTGTSRVSPKWIAEDTKLSVEVGGPNQVQYPTASICRFSITVPSSVKSKQQLADQMLLAIEYGRFGFKDE